MMKGFENWHHRPHLLLLLHEPADGQQLRGVSQGVQPRAIRTLMHYKHRHKHSHALQKPCLGERWRQSGSNIIAATFDEPKSMSH